MAIAIKTSSTNVVPFSAPFDWNNPDVSLAGGSTTLAPHFPLFVLGDEAAKWAEETATSANAPVDYVGASLISGAAGLIGNSREVGFGSWSEPSIIWTVLVGEASDKKSPGMASMKRHIDALERELGEANPDQEAAPPRIRIGNTTPRATQQIAFQNPRGLILQLDEVSGWWDQASRPGNEQFWLEAYGGGSYTVDRMNQRGLLIPHLSVSVMGTTQPDSIRDLLSAKTERGFAARYLYIYPEPKRGFVRPQQIDEDLTRDALGALLDLKMSDNEPVRCDLNDGAAEVAEAWMQKHDERVHRAQGQWAQWLGKQAGMLLRYALVFEHLWWAFDGYEANEPSEISDRAVRAAALFIDDYAIPMAARTYSMTTRPVEEQQASSLIRMLVRHDARQFNARGFRRGEFGVPPRDLKDADVMNAACETLEGAGLIRSVATRAGANKGRMRTDFETNPALFN